MWFKAMKVFKVSPPNDTHVDDWREGLQRQLSQPCPSNAALSYGWKSVFPDNDADLVASVGKTHAVEFVVSTRLLPQDVVRQAVRDRIAEIEAQQGIPVPKKEQRRMQDEVHFELLPKAFVQKKSVTVCWHEESQTVWVSSTQNALLESFITCWSHCLPGWQLKPLQTNRSVTRSLTTWMKNDEPLPDGFEWGDACQLVDPQDRTCSIRFSGNELASKTVGQHLEDGMQVKQAALVWREKLRFVVADDCLLTQIKALDVESEYEQGQSKSEQIAMDIALMAPMYHACVEELILALGGEAEDANKQKNRSLVEDYA